jgi:hypothetical protein
LVLAANPPGSDNTGLLLVLLGNGDGTFQVGSEEPTPSTALGAVATGDLDGDGLLDILVAGTDGQLSTYRSLSPGNVQLLQIVQLPGQPQRPNSIGIGRLTGASFSTPDVVVATEQGTFLVPSLGNGQLGAPMQLPLLDSASSVVVTDLDGDGKDDLVVVGQADGLVQVAWQPELGFGTGGALTVQTFRVDQADYVTLLPDRGQGQALLVCGYQGLANVLHVDLMGNVVQGPALPLQGSTLRQCGAGDFNGDGQLDLVVPAFTDVTVFLGALEGL